MKGSLVSNGLFPKYEGPNGEQFFLYSKRHLHDVPCKHAGPLLPLTDSFSMEQVLTALDDVIQPDGVPISDAMSEANGEAVSLLPTATHRQIAPSPDDILPWIRSTMDNERMALLVSFIQKKPK